MPEKSPSPASAIRLEAQSLLQLAARFETSGAASLERALTLLESCTARGSRVAVTGVGKSGLIARKIAATLSSTGTPAWYLNPVDALHGDLGMFRPGDLLIALSYSGETEELTRLLPAVARLTVPVIALTGCLSSTLAAAADVALDVSVTDEACSLNLAPTASTTAMLALGDAIAVELSRRKGFGNNHFAELHPGGRLGRRLACVRDLMHTGDKVPAVPRDALVPQVIYEMSRKHLGMTTIAGPDAELLGIISDGDIRRLLERLGAEALVQQAEHVMNASPRVISPTASAAEALNLMENHKITSLVVVENAVIAGVIHLHDLWHLSTD